MASINDTVTKVTLAPIEGGDTMLTIEFEMDDDLQITLTDDEVLLFVRAFLQFLARVD